MLNALRTARGFSLTELMLVVAVAATLLAIGVPVMQDLSETTKLNEASRQVERELQSARLKAVSVNATLRVRLNCPADGYFRTVEVIGSAEDNVQNRCVVTAYPFPAQDSDLMTLPNFDGPLRVMPQGTTVTSAVLEFRPNGTAYQVVSNTPQAIATDVAITVTRKNRTRTVRVNRVGKIQLQ
ncbi:MAG TPA: prepilin-type N-terminal cleavage/methylation domain-containing protein [Vicinamibacterales bacterium]|nr:prepilin-type N-terminal cleavage/methylation domain-containing protein [Vicinamibacterales bacterium]